MKNYYIFEMCKMCKGKGYLQMGIGGLPNCFICDGKGWFTIKKRFPSILFLNNYNDENDKGTRLNQLPIWIK